MIDLILAPVALVYLIVVSLLFVYGANFLYMTYLSTRPSHARQAAPPETWPVVTVQLPIYNELYVVERLIEAVADLDYPAGRLEIQVLDDSTDETAGIVALVAQRLQARGVEICVLRREVRSGFKAGALAEALPAARGEFLAIFDADFTPQPDFLRRTIPHFFAPGGERLAFIQTRWGHVNREYSLLTFLQSLSIDAHFMIEQAARCEAGYWFNFNGTAGIWRRQAIVDAGGWRADTLTEDLDLSYRAFFKGWKALYLKDVVAPAELPPSFNAYRRQQHRWAQGSFECAIRHLPEIWAAPVSPAVKLSASLHLTGYCVHLLMFGLALLYPVVLLLAVRYPALISLFGVALVFNLTAFAPTIFFLAAQRRLGRSAWRSLPGALFISAAGAGMMLNTVRAALNSVRGRAGTFERTPKFGVTARGQDWRAGRYQLRLDRIVFLELGLAAFNAATVALAIYLGNWLIALYAAVFMAGLVYTSGVTIAQSLAAARSRARRPE